ncbi:di-trans,poly-cis-decaprenylcistransferase [Alkalilimnicola ehrlichii]|uniref:Ditrans,polycis-undecaprenyl-diphosphate synthase ((2E,6E)-farnesyl-diphosphate specific) n=1 Tax=Alkalilimnicola ehrlichii TaxID=351052 RepID=A0A3E0WRS4_9GAMM|nr:isoprenyl transferase [Alkalilimnicola ehrlichii]RFA28250.1 di-trans,poly-cis-decaprenylcistransferase [Alkalilimnicola ehrlichii]RFA34851.1 di-trans,poly-cis-decaprenylcistransferase [Alkalilimnicola ehrlichii]
MSTAGTASKYEPLPRHVAIIMDGNGRWATARSLPRHAGHREGVHSVRAVVEACAREGVKTLSLFAFSSENWQRPKTEVSVLMGLFLRTLEKEATRLAENNIRLRLIGDLTRFPNRLQKQIAKAERITAQANGMTLVIAASYGGRWDIANAARRLAEDVAAGRRDPASIDADSFGNYVSLNDLPEPDLFIRTGGERRISNFLLWQLAYTELYFSDVLWPDFREDDLRAALADFATRQRRFGKVSEQLEQ